MRGIRSTRQPDPGGDESRAGNRRLLTIISAVLAVALVAIVITVLVTGDDEEAAPSRPGTAATPSASASATASPTQQPTTSPTEEPTQPAPSAAEDLAPFFAATVRLDQQLKTAAAAINATGPPWERITADVASKVQAADLGPVSRAVPAGLPHDLQQAVILVLSDLTSRRMAMQSFSYVGPVLPDEINTDQTNAKLLADLHNGHGAAVRFDDDLAAARALAADTAPIAPVPTQSRLTAEVLILVEYVRVANAGCNARGGAVFADLPEVVWRSVPGMPDAEGTVDIHVPEPSGEATVIHTEFNADLRPDGTWDVYLFVC
jgi:hypothetical protein